MTKSEERNALTQFARRSHAPTLLARADEVIE
jgi:hypothetical protein